eukprot:tig00000057_g119.t1
MKALLRGSGGGKRQDGQPPPFLTKTYQMVEDPNTNDCISWSTGENSFIIWKPADFARDILPRYFKHSNLSSFVRQLNIYGFRKNHPDMWEFAHENFMRGREDLLRDINRRKQSTATQQQLEVHQNNVVEQVDRLKKDKDVLVMELVRQRQAHSQMQNNIKRLVNEVSEWKAKQQETQETVDKIVNFLGALFSKTSIGSSAQQLITARKKRRAGAPDSPETNPANPDSPDAASLMEDPGTQLQTYTNGSSAAAAAQQPNPFAPGAKLNLAPEADIANQIFGNADAQNLLQELLSQRSLAKGVQGRPSRPQRSTRSSAAGSGSALISTASGPVTRRGRGAAAAAPAAPATASIEELADSTLSLSQLEDEDEDDVNMDDDDDDEELGEAAADPAPSSSRPPASAAAAAPASPAAAAAAAAPGRATSTSSDAWRAFLSSPEHPGLDDAIPLDDMLAPLPALSVKLEPGSDRAVPAPVPVDDDAVPPSPGVPPLGSPDLVELSDELLADALADVGIPMQQQQPPQQQQQPAEGPLVLAPPSFNPTSPPAASPVGGW